MLVWLITVNFHRGTRRWRIPSSWFSLLLIAGVYWVVCSHLCDSKTRHTLSFHVHSLWCFFKGSFTNEEFWFSAFYTAKYGYKVCLRVYLNGDGTGKGTHVSLFFVVMKGDYDALLPWPFRHKVRRAALLYPIQHQPATSAGEHKGTFSLEFSASWSISPFSSLTAISRTQP